MQPVKMAILGAGSIAQSMAKAMQALPDVTAYAVAARDINRARHFAQEHEFCRAYGSYEELVNDNAVELVYIATPHSHHAQQATLCINHGKAVLCEKAFTANAKQAEDVLQLAAQKKVFITEAMWTRFLPMAATVQKLVKDGVVGQVSLLSANLGFPLTHVPRMVQPQLAGGALLDLGIYPLNFAAIAFGTTVEKVQSTAVLNQYGVDAQNTITLQYENGRLASLYSTFLAATSNSAVLCGEEGYLVVDGINNPQAVRIHNKEGQETSCIQRPPQVNGYEYEVQACVRALREGRLFCEEMPHAETLRIMRMMDALRAEWGVVYPFETQAGAGAH